MGPLGSLKIVELAGIGPGPMCAMLLADLGARVLRIERSPPAADLGVLPPPELDVLLRGRQSIALDLKRPGSVELLLEIIAGADGLIEGFRPGVAERLGFGPEVCARCNPRLVYGRITGFGQSGPLAHAAAHDLNYIALTGTLHAIGRAGHPPTPPLNLVGDFGGGALYLALGMVSAMLEALTSNAGQVVDAAMVDGSASLMTSLYGRHAAGMVGLERGTNLLDSGAPFYDCYECADGKWVSVAALERRFFATLLRLLEIDPDQIGDHRDRANWPRCREILERRFLSRSRDDWCAVLEGSDACFAPVLSMEEAPFHPHLAARQTFVQVAGVTQPAPAPRFSRTAADLPQPPSPSGSCDPAQALAGFLPADRIGHWLQSGLVNDSLAS